MKPINRFLFWFLTSLSLTIVACQKSPVLEPPQPWFPSLLLVQMQQGQTVSRFDYDATDNLLTITDSSISNANAYKTRLEYNNGKLIKASYSSMTQRFSYPDANSVVVETGSLANPLLDREVYTYSSGRPAGYIRYYYESATDLRPEFRRSFTYDAVGNLVKEEEEGYDSYEKDGCLLVVSPPLMMISRLSSLLSKAASMHIWVPKYR